MKKRASTAAALIGAATLWMTIEQPPQWTPPPEAPYDFTKTYANKMSFWRFNAAGERVSHLEVEAATQPLKKPVTELSGIQLASRTSDGQQWEAKAERGVLWDRNNRLNLEKAVELKLPEQGITVHTDQLNLDLRRKTARSSNTVAIDSETSHTTGRGLYADLENRLLKLHQDVETLYAQPK